MHAQQLNDDELLDVLRSVVERVQALNSGNSSPPSSPSSSQLSLQQRIEAPPHWQTLAGKPKPKRHEPEVAPPPEKGVAQPRAPPDDVLTIKQIVATGVMGRTRLSALLASGELPCRRLGRRVIVLHRDWLAFLTALPSGPVRNRTVASQAHEAHVSPSASRLRSPTSR